MFPVVIGIMGSDGDLGRTFICNDRSEGERAVKILLEQQECEEQDAVYVYEMVSETTVWALDNDGLL